MITTVKGRIPDVKGTIYLDEQNPKNSSVEATLNVASLDTRTEQRDQHLRSADFLEVEKYPEIKFRSTRIQGEREKLNRRRDFGLTWNQVLEAGGVVVGNDIKISLDVQAVKTG